MTKLIKELREPVGHFLFDHLSIDPTKIFVDLSFNLRFSHFPRHGRTHSFKIVYTTSSLNATGLYCGTLLPQRLLMNAALHY